MSISFRYCSTIENVSVGAIETLKPLVYLVETPISKADQTICKGLDFVEQRVPGVCLPPEMVWTVSINKTPHSIFTFWLKIASFIWDYEPIRKYA